MLHHWHRFRMARRCILVKAKQFTQRPSCTVAMEMSRVDEVVGAHTRGGTVGWAVQMDVKDSASSLWSVRRPLHALMARPKRRLLASPSDRAALTALMHPANL